MSLLTLLIGTGLTPSVMVLCNLLRLNRAPPTMTALLPAYLLAVLLLSLPQVMLLAALFADLEQYSDAPVAVVQVLQVQFEEGSPFVALPPGGAM